MYVSEHWDLLADTLASLSRAGTVCYFATPRKTHDHCLGCILPPMPAMIVRPIIGGSGLHSSKNASGHCWDLGCILPGAPAMIVRTGRDVDRDTVFFDRLRSNGFAVEDISAEVRETLPPAVASLLRVAATEEPYAPAWTVPCTPRGSVHIVGRHCWKTWLDCYVHIVGRWVYMYKHQTACHGMRVERGSVVGAGRTLRGLCRARSGRGSRPTSACSDS